MWIFLLLFLLSPVWVSALSVERPDSTEVSNLQDSGLNRRILGRQEDRKVIRPVSKNSGNGTVDRCLKKCTLEGMLVEKQAEIAKLNTAGMAMDRLQREKADLEERLRRMEGKGDNSHLKEPERNTILLMGGFKAGMPHDGMAILSANRFKWEETQLILPYKTGASCAIYFNGEIYLIGGLVHSKVMHKLDKNLTWTRLADMNVERHGITNSCLEWNGYIWVFGGTDRDEKGIKDVERYDPKTDKWTVMPDMKHKRAYAAALLWHDRIIVSGGYGDNFMLTNTMESFNFGRWMELDNLPRPFNSHTLVHYKNMIMIIGGWDGMMAHNEVWEVDPQEINTIWRSLPPKTVHTNGLGGIVLDDEIYAMGGWFNVSLPLDQVEIFNGERWRDGPSLPFKWTNMAALTVPQSLADRLIAYDP